MVGFSYHQKQQQDEWLRLLWGSFSRSEACIFRTAYTQQKAKLLGKYASETRLDVYGCNGKSSPYLAEGGFYPVCLPPLQSSMLSPSCHHLLPLTRVTWLVQDEARTQILKSRLKAPALNGYVLSALYGSETVLLQVSHPGYWLKSRFLTSCCLDLSR